MRRGLLLLSALLAAGCDADKSFARMIHQPRAEAYGTSGFFPNGAAMQAPPADTVPRGAREGAPLLEEGRAAGGAYAARIPLPVTRELLERGRDRYDIFCAACHGILGNSSTPVAERMQLRPPPSLLKPSLRAFPPGRIYETIRQGYGLMPSYASELTVEERWAVVAYVRALGVSAEMRLEDLPPEVREEARRELR